MSSPNDTMCRLMILLVVFGCTSSEPTNAQIAQSSVTPDGRTSEASEPTEVPELVQPKVPQLFVNATRVVSAYRQFVFDFGMRPIPVDNAAPATASIRVYLNCYTAKRMQMALEVAVQRHAEFFGQVEPDEPAKMSVPPEVALRASYANFVRLTGTPEELLIDLGVNTKPIGASTKPIYASAVLVMDTETGDTLLKQLNVLLNQYEAEHGRIEVDVQKRVRRGPVR